ncbi:hypothetical protein BP5796_00362 [Coleophoma crateriformis]|uniref:UspA domain-containing protein n=1 Tax=Coleophoma crateriformis TaxID=565419 RepID=A0A3D8T7S2_9HELO|nr:hypothetical protein BP5796_00362 [Coleophoma crateriformis]
MSAPQSQEMMAAEEAKGVLALLEGQTGRPRGSSTPVGSPTTTQAPVKSMLDVGDSSAAAPRHASIAGTVPRGISFATPPVPKRSNLDAPDSPRNRLTHSAQASPTEATHKAVKDVALTRHRSQSDASSHPAEFGPRITQQPSLYRFSNFLTNNPGGAIVPKRNTQGGKRQSLTGAMASALTGDLSGLMGRGGRSRHDSIGSTHSKSRSPHGRLSLRPDSPSLKNNKIELESGRVIDKNAAYQRLSDANLANAGGNLSELGEKGQRSRQNSSNEPTLARFDKDSKSSNTEDAVAESSEEEQSSDDEGPRGRGRKKARSTSNDSDRSNDSDQPEPRGLALGRGSGLRESFSMSSDADNEKVQIKEDYKVISLLEPEITVTSPGSDQPRSSRVAIHPNTSFESNSGFNTPVDSDAEENIVDIKRAQRLAINMTDIMSTPATKRCVRVMYRGDFPKMQQEASDEIRRVRKYVVAMDLSPESQHALEWTVGTVLRDGDTLLAIYCAEETSEESAINGDDVLPLKSSSTPVLAPNTGPIPIRHSLPRLDSPSASSSPAGRKHGKLEHERMKYVQVITDRLSQLLRKTKLQVRVVIEVIHCKSPKHLIVEVIDYVNPTMVVLGSRGRSSLQGVMLGSFSNYLVTKSSVPVMVARKKLKKHNKIKRPRVRLANNLSNPSSRALVDARID